MRQISGDSAVHPTIIHGLDEPILRIACSASASWPRPAQAQEAVEGAPTSGRADGTESRDDSLNEFELSISLDTSDLSSATTKSIAYLAITLAGGSKSAHHAFQRS